MYNPSYPVVGSNATFARIADSSIASVAIAIIGRGTYTIANIFIAERSNQRVFCFVRLGLARVTPEMSINQIVLLSTAVNT